MSPSPYLLLPFFPFLPLGYSMDFCGAVGSDGLMASSSSNGGGGIIGSILASLDSDPSKQRVLFGSNHLKHGRSGAPDEHAWRSLKVGRTNSHSLFPDGEQMLNFSSNAAASPYYHHLSSPSYARNPDLVYGIPNGSMHGFWGGARGPFTPSQLMKLKHQALIYTYIDAKMPIPSSLATQSEGTKTIIWSITNAHMPRSQVSPSPHGAHQQMQVFPPSNVPPAQVFKGMREDEVRRTASFLKSGVLGKLYRKLGELLLARQAFDHARSIDPSLALPWAGMSVDSQDGKCSPNETYESCLRAVQILPLAEFQLGLGSLAAASGHLLSPQVFGGIRQAIQRAPFYPELHNLNGLVCEARSDYQSAVAAYRLARCALLAGHDSEDALKSHLADVSFNLARSLCQAGHALDAAHQCEALQEEGLLDSNGFQIYAVALWQLGKNEQALAIAKNLAGKVSSMKQTCATAALGLICTLVYCISGHDRAASMILKLHKGFFHSARMTCIVATIDALGPMGKLQLFDPNTSHNFTSRETVAELHSIIATGKMIRHGAVDSLDIYSGVNYLQRALHMYPESSILRSQLSSLLLASGDWIASHKATRCIVISRGPPVEKCLKSPYEIHGAAGIACYASAAANLKFSFQNCNGQPVNRTKVVYHLQKWLHQEPWNQEAKYLLVLNLLQKAREEKFPHHLCVTLKRLITSALSKEIYVQESELYNYEKFLILLCNSEINLQLGDYHFCIRSATDALGLHPSSSDIFFAHLQLCRVYATLKDLPSLRNEFTTCLQVKTNRQIGWISLKYLESKYKLENSSVAIDTHFQSCITGIGSSSSMWATVYNLVQAQSFIWDQDFLSAEQALAHACSVGDADSCLLLCHGAVCMELARQQAGSQFLWRAVTSLAKAQEVSSVPLPIVSVLLAQTEASLGSRGKWERHLRLEWLSWPAGIRPAELYFQMHLLQRQAAGLPDRHAMIEPSLTSEKWLLRAIHLNPSCLRYWKVLQKITVS